MRKNIFALLLCFYFAPVFAQAQIEAYIDKDIVSMGDSVILSVNVTNGGSSPKVVLPSLPSFEIQSSGQSQSVTIINGKTSSSVTYNYLLSPRVKGKTEIEPIKVIIDGKEYLTQPIPVTAVSAGKSSQYAQTRAGGKTSAKGERVFLSVKPNKINVYTNEQVTVITRLYTRTAFIGQPTYIPPKMNGFTYEDMPPQRQGTEIINGVKYYYSEIRSALFPLKNGRLEIGGAQVNYTAADDANVDSSGDDFLSSFFSQTAARPRTAESSPFYIQVKPLPEKGKPPSFTGAVGQYKISATVEKSDLAQGETGYLNIKLEGTGDIKSVSLPAIQPVKGLYFYDAVPSVKMKPAADIIQGRKIFRIPFTAKENGTFAIPPLAFSYFDPAKEQYVVIKTERINISAKGPGASSLAIGFAEGKADTAQIKLKDIAYIKTNGAYRQNPLLFVLKAGKLNFIAIALILLFLGLDILKRSPIQNIAFVKGKKISAKLKKEIAKSQNLLTAGKTAEFAKTFSRAFREYISAKLNLPAETAITNRDFACRIGDKAGGQAIAQILAELDAVSFAPIGAKAKEQAKQTLKTALDFIEKLDRGH